MSGIQQTLLGGSPAGYQIERSLRFNSADSAELNRTFGTPTNNKIFTISAWVKTTNPSAGLLDFSLLSVGDAGIIGIAGSGGFGATYNNRIFIRNGGSTGDYWLPLLRDVSAWYHFVIAIDTTQATQADRAKLWINGVSQASNKGASTLSLNATMSVNAASTAHYIGGRNAASYYSNGYLTEYNFIDGQALTPSDFGETDSATGVWKPKKFSGTYGTNGFYLNFSDNSNTTSTTLGKDSSGNGNNWTPNLFSVTAGAGNDSLVDTPTSYGTDTGAGGEVRGNYATQNALVQTSNLSLSNGNLTITGSGAYSTTPATLGMSSGKWYWEYTCTTYSASGDTHYGIGTGAFNIYQNTWAGSTSAGWIYAASNGNKYNNSSAVAYGATFTSGDIIGVAFDADVGTLTFYKNGATQGTAYTGLTSGPYFPLATVGTSNVTNANFGQRPFAYTAPSGFKALCTQNLPTPTIGATSTTQAGKYFNPVLYTGTGSNLAVTGVGFQPDLLWIKQRAGTESHTVFDAVRGVDIGLTTNTTAAEVDFGVAAQLSFDSDGFTLGTNGRVNTNTSTFVAWNWKANGAGSSNTAGTITSTVSANTTAGFSIVTYTGNGTAGATVGHGLGVAPSMVIVKKRNTTGGFWITYHQSIGNTTAVALNDTSASYTPSTAYWNNTSPTSSVFTIGNGSGVNTLNDTYVAYCFAAVAGYSAFGSYTGNGSTDGPFVYCGFRPRYIMIKRTDSANDWLIIDTSRNPYNVTNLNLWANLSTAEGTADRTDVLSNGFKLRNSLAEHNASGGTYIYAAFCESPFKFSLAR